MVERHYGCRNKCRAQGELHRIIGHMDFAIVCFCRVTEVKPFPVVASGESLN